MGVDIGLYRKMKTYSKVFWKFIQSKTKTKINEKIQTITDEEGNIQTDNNIKANLLNTFFRERVHKGGRWLTYF